MKKFIFSFAAIMMMVCAAVTLSSCSSDDDDQNVTCSASWADAKYESGAIPSASEATVVDRTVAAMNTRTTTLLGSSFSLASEDGTNPTLDARNAVRNKLVADSEMTTMFESLANYKVASVTFYLKSADGTKTLYQETFNTSSYKK